MYRKRFCLKRAKDGIEICRVVNRYGENVFDTDELSNEKHYLMRFSNVIAVKNLIVL